MRAMRAACWALAASLALVGAEQCGNVGGPPALGGLCRVAGPKTPAEQPAWLEGLRKDRAAFAARTGYSGGVFDTPGLAWAKRAFIQPQFHPFDRFFYDRAAGNYTVDRALPLPPPHRPCRVGSDAYWVRPLSLPQPGAQRSRWDLRGRVAGRPGGSLRGDRRRADVADLPQPGHRRPQPV